MRNHLRKRPSPSMGVALVALFVALGGTTYAATGGNFILGTANTAGSSSALSSGVTTGPTLNVTNTGGRSAARFTTNAGITPFSVSNSTKIGSLNSDLLDGLDSTAFRTPSAGTTSSSVNVTACAAGVIASYPLSLSRPGRIFAAGTVDLRSPSPPQRPEFGSRATASDCATPQVM